MPTQNNTEHEQNIFSPDTEIETNIYELVNDSITENTLEDTFFIFEFVSK